jgi:hypothetical protein
MGIRMWRIKVGVSMAFIGSEWWERERLGSGSDG